MNIFIAYLQIKFDILVASVMFTFNPLNCTYLIYLSSHVIHLTD